jgi:putative hemolysin
MNTRRFQICAVALCVLTAVLSAGCSHSTEQPVTKASFTAGTLNAHQQAIRATAMAASMAAHKLPTQSSQPVAQQPAAPTQ